MLAVGKSGYNWCYSSVTVPTTTPGFAVTPGVDSMGSYVQMVSGANLSKDCYWVRMFVLAGNTTATIRDILIDIGLDQAGGTAYAQLGGINNIFTPQAANFVAGGRWFGFPLFIKAGTSVGARAQSNVATTVRVAMWFFGQPVHPEMLSVGTYSETIGVSGNGGTPFTCGSTGTFGSWTSLGTTTRPCWYWQLAWGHNVGTTTSQAYVAELGYGDGTNIVTIIKYMPMHNPAAAEASANGFFSGIWEVPAGSTLYVRGGASGTAETTEAVAVGIGG
jgi:hypothetical protein